MRFVRLTVRIGLGSPTWAFSHIRLSVSALEARCLRSPNLALMPRRFLKSYWFLVCLGSLKKQFLKTAKEGCSYMTDELISKSEGKQATSKRSPTACASHTVGLREAFACQII